MSDSTVNAHLHNWPKMNRRRFIKVSGIGGGLAIGGISGCGPTEPRPSDISMQSLDSDQLLELNAFVHVLPDGQVQVYAKNPEIGQGIKTSFPMIVAEEMDADFTRIKIVQSPINQAVFGAQFAGGSRSTPDNWDRLRQAGATARAMLISAAADRWGVDQSQCRTEAHQVINMQTGASLDYAELTFDAAKLPLPDAERLELKSRDEYRLLGTRVSGVDNPDIVQGKPLFGIDQQLPGMKYAAFAKAPRIGGRAVSANLDEILDMPGISQAFILGGSGGPTQLRSGVAIVGDNSWRVFKAKRALRIEWDNSNASTDDWQRIQADAESKANQSGTVLAETGDVDTALQNSSKTLKAWYSYKFVGHATLEPQNCTAWYHEGILEFWAPSQTPGSAIPLVADTLGLPAESIVVHQTRVGGGFGRRLMNDYVCEAGAIAKMVAAPIKLQWDREDDMRDDFFRAGGFNQLEAALSPEGKMQTFHNHHISFTNDGDRAVAGGGPFTAAAASLEFPVHTLANYRMSQTLLPLQIPCGYWRAPFSNTLAFVTQSFFHEVSDAAGRDHLEFLLELMGNGDWLVEGNPSALNPQRGTAVIRAVAEMAGWGREMEPGRALGLAFYFSHRGHFAEVVDVSVDEDKAVLINKVWVAGDIGLIVNKSGAEHQWIGSVLDGISSMAAQEIDIDEGAIRQTNFHQYPLLRIQQVPEVEVQFIESDFSPTGSGEPALPPIAPAVCNAIYTASGHRIRNLPMSVEGFSLKSQRSI